MAGEQAPGGGRPPEPHPPRRKTTAYWKNKAVLRAMKARVLAVMEEMGTAPLDHLADHLEVTEQYVRANAEALVEEGRLSVIPGRAGPRGEGRRPRMYVYGDGSPEQRVPVAALPPGAPPARRAEA